MDERWIGDGKVRWIKDRNPWTLVGSSMARGLLKRKAMVMNGHGLSGIDRSAAPAVEEAGSLPGSNGPAADVSGDPCLWTVRILLPGCRLSEPGGSPFQARTTARPSH
jgi:hypothetical protein